MLLVAANRSARVLTQPATPFVLRQPHSPISLYHGATSAPLLMSSSFFRNPHAAPYQPERRNAAIVDLLVRRFAGNSATTPKFEFVVFGGFWGGYLEERENHSDEDDDQYELSVSQIMAQLRAGLTNAIGFVLHVGARAVLIKDVPTLGRRKADCGTRRVTLHDWQDCVVDEGRAVLEDALYAPLKARFGEQLFVLDPARRKLIKAGRRCVALAAEERTRTKPRVSRTSAYFYEALVMNLPSATRTSRITTSMCMRWKAVLRYTTDTSWCQYILIRITSTERALFCWRSSS